MPTAVFGVLGVEGKGRLASVTALVVGMGIVEEVGVVGAGWGV
jgi:hypothetical protein